MFLAVGPCLKTSTGPQPLTFQEIESWSRVSRIVIEGHEAELIKMFSDWYCNDWYLSRSPDYPDPDGSSQNVGEVFGDLLKRFST
jgi:hypothetical protein